MSDQPHSLLDAARMSADALGVDWAIVQRYYRDLQRELPGEAAAWLPKSQGRQVWAAHPNFIARLFIAMGAAQHPDGSNHAVGWVAQLSPVGAAPDAGTKQSAVELALSEMLASEDLAAKVDRVEFDPVRATVSIVPSNGTLRLFELDRTSGDAGGALYRIGVIPGRAFAHLARTVRWRRGSDRPYLTSPVEQAAA